MPPDVRLRSSDGAVFTASAEASRLSPLISYAVDHLQDDQVSASQHLFRYHTGSPHSHSFHHTQEIPIPNVRGEILEMVLRYLEYHAAEHGDAEAQSWDNSFIDTGSVSVLIDIIQVRE